MRLLNNTLITLFIFLMANSIQAQSDKKTYTIKKGQVFDIIMLANKPNIEAKLQDYFKRALPIATASGYHGLGGYAIKESPTQGNYHPQSMIFGYWDDLPKRLEFLETIADKMPDFHQMRRDIWSTFGLTYYTFDKDVSFEIDRSQVNVVTAYWIKEGQSFDAFKKEWETKASKTGGEIIIGFTNGTSPFGYNYNPYYLLITSWKDKEAFEAFKKQNVEMNHKAIEHVNQFILF